MVGRKKTPTDKAPQFNSLNPGEADLNEIVAYMGLPRFSGQFD